MRTTLVLVPLLLSATPALAQSSPPATTQLPKVLTDPRTAEKLDHTMRALTDALLDVRVGEIQAAAEGREATLAEKRLRVRDVAHIDEKQLRRQVAEAGPKIAQGMKAMSDALPAITKALDDAGKAIDRAAANMPDPTYPKR